MKKILFIKIAALGDVVMALPTSRYLVSQGHQVTWLVGKSAAPLVRQYSLAQEIIEVDEKELLQGSMMTKALAVLKINAKLLGKNFDHILLGHADPRYRLLTKFSRGEVLQFSADRTRHHTDVYFEMAQKILGKSADRVASYLPQARIPWAGSGSKKIALAPGGAKNYLADDDLRRWPVEYYAKLAKNLIEQGFEVHIFGGPTDLWVLPPFAGIEVTNQIGKFDLLSLIDFWSDFRLLITHDSGPLHLGGLSGIPVLGLFGPTLPEWRFPKNNKGLGLTLAKKLDCQPCYDGKAFAACSHKNCLRQLSVDSVLATIADNRLHI